MTVERLTTLAAVKDWLGIKPEQTQSDVGLIRVINAASQFVLGYLNRDGFSPRTYTDHFRGNGKNSMLLRNWPVLSVTSVGIGSTSIPLSNGMNVAQPNAGFMLSDPRQAPQSIDLFGSYSFYYRMPGQIVYEAGYRQSEDMTVTTHEEGDPAETVVDPWTPLNGQWVSGISVHDGDTLFTQVSTAAAVDGTGRYYIDEWGVYTFAVVDAGKELTVAYAYVPWDISFAVTETIGEWYKKKEHIGILSKTLGGQETVTFSNRDLSDVTMSVFQPYRNVVPV